MKLRLNQRQFDILLVISTALCAGFIYHYTQTNAAWARHLGFLMCGFAIGLLIRDVLERRGR